MYSHCNCVCTHIILAVVMMCIILFSLQITHSALQSNEEIKSVFITYFVSCLPCYQFISTQAVDAVYLELTRKLCNTRIQEFFDSTRQIQSAKAGKGTLKGQNLRDNLLSQHVNLKSKST